MKIVNASVEEIKQGQDILDMYTFIDKCAGVTVNRQTTHKDNTDFVRSLIERGHMPPLEFGTVYLVVSREDLTSLTINYTKNPYSKVRKVKSEKGLYYYITTNYRVLVENGAQRDLRFWSQKTKHHYERRTVRLRLSRGIADEFARHRTISPLMKSTRYCDELKGGLRFVKPYWFENAKWIVKQLYKLYLKVCSWLYSFLRKKGLKPQEAREILPLCLETEMLMCGFINTPDNIAWDRFFKLRCNSAAHPNAKILADIIRILFNETEES